MVALASMPIVVLYPLAKRYFRVPQLVLGFAFNWGAFVGWAAVHGSLDLDRTLPLYLAGICWTIVYDTIYAHQVCVLFFGFSFFSIFIGCVVV